MTPISSGLRVPGFTFFTQAQSCLRYVSSCFVEQRICLGWETLVTEQKQKWCTRLPDSVLCANWEYCSGVDLFRSQNISWEYTCLFIVTCFQLERNWRCIVFSFHYLPASRDNFGSENHGQCLDLTQSPQPFSDLLFVILFWPSFLDSCSFLWTIFLTVLL